MNQKFVIPTPKNHKNEYTHYYVHLSQFWAHLTPTPPKKGQKQATGNPRGTIHPRDKARIEQEGWIQEQGADHFILKPNDSLHFFF